MSSLSSVVQCCLSSGSGTVKSIFGPRIPSNCELEAKLRGLVDLSLVERPFVAYCAFVIIREEVGNDL